ncbi:MAG: Asp-tRNA(Asn)/Glu-tRNA(Gln) amidotransferase subunit GatB [Pseudomonadota bacterium]|nr:Asp-tRNA(Asn)/Glu-tRNA(Gln) amidotransferase subunit GatB [Pseudomonadota bacterium]
MPWQPVIGLEVHVQLKTKSKIFSPAATLFGASPNSQTNEIDLGLPGALPFLNQEAVNMAIKFGLGSHAIINKRSIFARKHYFYPDLPKGYQISQNKFPIISGGHLDIALENDKTKRINLTRAHLEEDAGKSIHYDGINKSGIDLNRAGMPLLEIVTEPDLRSATEAVTFLKTLHNLVCYLDICDGNMQEGSFRCDANISVRLSEEHEFGTRVEIKNINSFRFVEQAINYEIERQIDCIKHGEEIVQETRLFDSAKKVTKSMRNKENAHDYRYFTEPDLPPLLIEQEKIDIIRHTMPELPWVKRDRFISQYNLSAYDANILTSSKKLADYYESCCKLTNASSKLVANWVTVELLGMLNKSNKTLDECLITPAKMADLTTKIADNSISGKTAKTIFDEIWQKDISVSSIIESKGLSQITDEKEITEVVNKIITKFPEQVTDYKSGKDKLFAFFIGQAMQATKGRANPKLLQEILRKNLGK